MTFSGSDPARRRGAEREKKHAAGKKGERASRPDGLGIATHVTGDEQGDPERRGATGKTEVDQGLRSHVTVNSLSGETNDLPAAWYRDHRGLTLR